MPDFASDITLLHLGLFDAAFAVAPDEEEAVRRRFMTLLVHEGHRHRGGSAEVFCATNLLGERFAIKRLHVAPSDDNQPVPPAQPTAPARKELRHSLGSSGSDAPTPDYVTAGHVAAFYEEYRIHLSISNLRGFPRVFGFGLTGAADSTDGSPVIVMEWVEGLTLRAAVRARAAAEAAPLPLTTIAHLGLAVLEQLRRADELSAHFVHRDLSPRNIMLRTDTTSAATQLATGSFDLCLVDFGSATLCASPNEATFTARSNVWRMGTPAYAPPEMLTSDIALPASLRQSSAIDVYALCSVLFELYGGERPFDLTTTDGRSPYRIKTEDAPRPLAPREPDGGALAALVCAGLSPRQEDRPTAAQLAVALDNWLHLPDQRVIGRFAGALAADARIWQPGAAERQLTRRRFLAAGVGGASALVSWSLAAAALRRLRPAPLDESRYPRADTRYEGVPLYKAYDAAFGSWGFYDAEGNPACQPVSTREPGALREGLIALFDDLSERWGFATPAADGTSTWYVLPAFAQARDYSEGLAAAQELTSKLWGYVDGEGAWAISPRFAEAADFSCGVAAVRARGSDVWGAIDTDGAWLLEPAFAALGSCDGEMQAVAQDQAGLWGIVDDAGTWQVNPQFAQLRRLTDGLAPAFDRTRGLWGYISADGSWAIEPCFCDARPFAEGQAAVQDAATQLWHFIDPGGQPVVKTAPSLWKLGDLHDGLAPAQAAADDDVLVFDENDPDAYATGVGGRYGYVDAGGSWALRRLTTLADTSIGPPGI